MEANKLTLRIYRGAKIEAVFGQLKHNGGLRKLSTRRKKMVALGVGVKAIAHYHKKIYKYLKGEIGSPPVNVTFSHITAMAS